MLPITFVFPNFASATTCGTGSNITFTDIGGGQCRAFLTVGFGTSWTVPTNWNSANNTIETIGGGGAGGSENATDGEGSSGGGGGEYREAVNVTYTPGNSITVQIGQSGAHATGATPGTVSGSGTASFVLNNSNDTSIGAAVASSSAGRGGKSGPSQSGGAGGTGGTGTAANNNGGNGGASVTGQNGGSGGGGAGGPNGVGSTGGTGGSGSARGGGGGAGNGGGTTSFSSDEYLWRTRRR